MNRRQRIKQYEKELVAALKEIKELNAERIAIENELLLLLHTEALKGNNLKANNLHNLN